VFLQHGFLQNSEAWVVRGPGKALPYILVDAGYDVWLGNNRGNKYSFKHRIYPVNTDKFWDFCLDHLALYDIPAMIQYILNITKVDKLSYIGFSQGTTLGFACFSMNSELASKIDIFVALAPASKVKELKNPAVAALTTSRPEMVFLLFGKRALLPQTHFYRQRLTTSMFIFAIDVSCQFLFGWTMKNIDPAEKGLLYSHLYSYGSVKTLVQWFQITRTKRFQMFDDHVRTSEPNNREYNNYLLPAYQLSKISCPIAVFYGGRDSIPDNQAILSELPSSTYVHFEEKYEHLDFQWAFTAPEKIFSKVLNLINEHSRSSNKFHSLEEENTIFQTMPKQFEYIEH